VDEEEADHARILAGRALHRTAGEEHARAGDFSYEAIQQLGNPVPMLVHNGGDELLELWLEPFGQDYWLRPGEVVTVTSYGEWDGHPFETVHEPGRIEVWASSWFATVSDSDGNEIPAAHQRPRENY
jgi:hypothetical protein